MDGLINLFLVLEINARLQRYKINGGRPTTSYKGASFMKSDHQCLVTKIIALVTFLAMIVVNALAVLLPINGITTGQVSDSYPNLFAPAGFTFSIWSLIYLLLALYTVYMLAAEKAPTALICRVNVLFSLSSVANVLWVLSWHNKLIPLSMLLMVLILVCLIIIMRMVTAETRLLSEKFFIKLPFAVYSGWITVAAIANATILLVSLGWNGFGLSEEVWTVLILAVGAVIGMLAGMRFKSIAYLLVLIWAYFGILLKHLSITGFNGQYTRVIITAIVCMVLFALIIVYVAIKNRRARVKK